MLESLQCTAHKLAKQALENGHNPKFYSPFAKSAKKSLGINICGKISRLIFVFHSSIDRSTKTLTNKTDQSRANRN